MRRILAGLILACYMAFGLGAGLPEQAFATPGMSSSSGVSVKFQPEEAGPQSGMVSSGGVSVKFPAELAGPQSGMVSSGGISVKFPPEETSKTGMIGSWVLGVAFGTPLAQWHFDDNWLDSSGNNLTASPVNGASFLTGGILDTNSANFDGINDYLNIGTSSLLRKAFNFSLEAWIRIAPGSTGNMLIAGNLDETAKKGYALNRQDNTLNFKIGDGTIYSVSSVNPVPEGVWVYMAGTYDGYALKLYVNGTLENQTEISKAVVHSASFAIGYANGLNYFAGQIDEVAVYGRTLTDAEIYAAYLRAGGTDTIPPKPPTVNPVEPITTSPTMILSGKKDPESSILINSQTVVPLDSSEDWQASYGLLYGRNLISVTSRDSAGNESSPPVLIEVILDNLPPAIESSLPADNSAISQAADISINLKDDYSGIDMESARNSAALKTFSGTPVAGTWAISSANSLTFTPDAAFEEGTYIVTLHLADAMGNSAEAGITFTLDSVPPSVQSFGMNPPSPHKAESVYFSFVFNEPMLTSVSPTVLLVNGGISYPLSGTWSTDKRTWAGTYVFSPASGDGTYSVQISGAKDSAGNLMSPSVAGSFVLDTTPPSEPVVDDFQSPARNPQFSLSGQKEANTYLYVKGAKTSTPFADTSWTYAMSLKEGTNNITLYLMDEAGNQSGTLSKSIVLDTTAPRLLSSSPIGGSSSTQISRIDISLSDDNSSVDPEASVSGASVKILGQPVPGSWTIENGYIIFIPETSFSDGTYTVALYPTDTLGNKGTITFTFNVDNAPPSVQSFSMTPQSPHKAESVVFQFTFSENMSTSIQPSVQFGKTPPYEAYSLTGNWISSKTWQGTFQFTSSTGDGTYTVKISGAKDGAGNQMSPAQAGTFELDTAPPDMPTLNQVKTPTNVPNQAISGTKSPDSAIIINGIQRVPIDNLANWTYTYPLSEGNNNLSVVARDAAGNDSAVVNALIVLDTTPPLFTINNYQKTTNSSSQDLTGTKEPGSVVKLNGKQIFGADNMGQTWTYTVNLVEGISNHFVFTASDSLGNTRTQSIDILYDISAPSPLAPGILVADGNGSGTEVNLNWSAYAESQDIAYYRVFVAQSAFSDVTGMAVAGTVDRGTKTYKVTGLTEGSTYYFAVVPVDGSGNYNPAVNSVSAIPVDALAPEEVAITSVTVGFNETDGNWIILRWTPSLDSKGDLADQMIYFDDGRGYDSGTTIGKDATEYIKKGLADATKYKFKITVKDTYGHESQGSAAEAVTRLPNPANLKAIEGNQKITLSWDAVASPYLKQYNIYRIQSAVEQTNVENMVLVKTLKEPSYIDTGLANDQIYQYAVTVTNISGAEMKNVLSIAARPRMDETGPQITNFNITEGQIITEPFTIKASATDTESSVAGIELHVDGKIVSAVSSSNSISFLWNIVPETDGNHTVKVAAYDQYGNRTEVSRQVIVSLAPPPVPSITGHTVIQTSPEYKVNINGTVSVPSDIVLKLNGVVVSTISAQNGSFSFSSLALKEGDNLLAVKAVNRGGESAYCPNYKIVVDTGAPPAPVNFAGTPFAGGVIRFNWASGTGEMPSGFNIYMSQTEFISKTSAARANTSSILYTFWEYTPPDDNLRHFAVTAVDSSGNESEISNLISISSDRLAPSIASIDYTYYDPAGTAIHPITVAGTGKLKVSIQVTEPLKEIPFLSLESTGGFSILIPLVKIDDTHYSGQIDITAQMPDGQMNYKFSAKDMIGNRGVSQGESIALDLTGPAAEIKCPVQLQNISAEPVQVEIALTEPSTVIPQVELKGINNSSRMIENLSSTDNINWTGSINISGMPEGQAEFVLLNAVDRFGNIGNVINSGRYILLYLNEVPPPGIPMGLTASSGAAGKIKLSWNPVGDALGYNLWCRGEGESLPVRVQGGLAGAFAEDLPPADDIYYYSVSALGLLQSESERSEEVEGISDRTGPPAPSGLVLSMSGSGVLAQWEPAGTGEAAKGYKLYRAGHAFGSSEGISRVAESVTASAVDTAPRSTERFYAVAALDQLGNEGPLSPNAEIDFPVAPIPSLVLEKYDSGAPALKWQAPSGNIAGYFIYRNGEKINEYPTISLSYTDGYYSGGAVAYGVSVMDNLGNESPQREAVLMPLVIGLKEGTILKRGLLETLNLFITNPNPVPVKIEALSTKVGSGTESRLSGPFTLDPNGTLYVEKVASTSADAPSQVAVMGKVELSPAPGTTLILGQTSMAQVTGGSSFLEIFNEPLIRGADRKVTIKINNIGSARMEVITSENNGSTPKFKVNLKDEDGNILSTAYMNQRTGAVVNVGSYAIARIEPGESFTSDPIALFIPSAAPYKVYVEAVIENIFYHYGSPDQVTAPGITQSIATTISDTPYYAFAEPEQDFYPSPQPVIISGQTLDSQTGGPVPYVPVKLVISLKGMDRSYTVMTGPDGSFAYAFTPASNEAGIYTIWAVHPDIKDRSIQSSFTIAGLRMEPENVVARIGRGRTLDIPFALANYGGGPLTGLRFDVQTSSGITASVLNPSDDVLAPGESASLTLRVTCPADAPDTGFAQATALVDQGAQAKLNASVAVVSLIPIISTNPSVIDTGMTRGSQKIASFTITNVGQETLRNARLEGLSTSWMALTIPKEIGDIRPGESRSVGIMLSPPDTLAQGIYDDKIVIYSDNHIPYNYNVQLTVASSAVGSVFFDVIDQLYEDVAGATITFQHQQLLELMYTAKTLSDGTALISDIPEGRYSYSISAPQHKPYSGSFEVYPGITTTVPIGLEVTFVEIEWTVVPIVIEDRYEIVVTQTFETNVPASVLIVEPPSVTLPEMKPGEVYNGEFTITNYGLISADLKGLNFPASWSDYELEVLSSLPPKLAAMQKITVPYRVKRRLE